MAFMIQLHVNVIQQGPSHIHAPIIQREELIGPCSRLLLAIQAIRHTSQKPPWERHQRIPHTLALRITFSASVASSLCQTREVFSSASEKPNQMRRPLRPRRNPPTSANSTPPLIYVMVGTSVFRGRSSQGRSCTGRNGHGHRRGPSGRGR